MAAKKKVSAKKASATKSSAKKTSAKPKGSDSSGNPVDLSSEIARRNEVNRAAMALYQNNKAEFKAASRNLLDIYRNQTTPLSNISRQRTIALGRGSGGAAGNASRSAGRFGGGPNLRGK
jgi:hypothetical protein